MQIDTASILRVLAHELRSPAGVAQGYLKMALDGRLSADDQRHGLEHARDAVARMTTLSREASNIASWLERPAAPEIFWRPLVAAALLRAVLERFGRDELEVSLDIGEDLFVKTCDEPAFVAALAALISATMRESPRAALTLVAAPTPGSPGTLDLLVAPADVLPLLAEGPDTAEAGAVTLERGGLGLSLVMALLVMNTHGATSWALRAHRATLGIRLLKDTGTLP